MNELEASEGTETDERVVCNASTVQLERVETIECIGLIERAEHTERAMRDEPGIMIPRWP